VERVKIGVAGTGGIFLGAHLPAILEVKEAKLTALYDINFENLKNAEKIVKEKYEEKIKKFEENKDFEKAEILKKDLSEITSYRDLNSFLKEAKIELVDICTSPASHSEIAKASLKANKNVMCEKPMARTYIEAEEIVEEVENSKKIYQHNENWIWDASWYNAKKLIDSGIIGEVQFMVISAAHSGPEWASWFWDFEIAGGGACSDMAIHSLTTSWFLAGFEKEPKKVKAISPEGISSRMSTRILEGKFQKIFVEDDAHFSVEYEDKNTLQWITANIEGSWCERDAMESFIVGSKGIIKFGSDEKGKYILIIDVFNNQRKIYFGGQSSFINEIRNMCKCVLENTKSICDERIGAESTAVLGCAYFSQKRDMKTVYLEEYKEYIENLKKREGKNSNKVLLREIMEGIKK
jgi:predicted dehydrogenase